MPADQSDSGGPAFWQAEPVFQAHTFFYIVAMFIWLIANLFFPGDWSAFWPLMIWSIVYMVHYMTYKMAHIDQDWVDERVLRIADEAKDYGHIENIRDDYTGIGRQRRPKPEDQTEP